MPTESTFLLAGLFFLAAALGYFFARFGVDDEEAPPSQPGRLNADYIRGLNFLLNEKPDQALEVFMRMVEVDDETLETHFALGSLFRRRGEVDRAIRVHQNIIARPNLSDMHREQALLSLAEDYLGAGLFDRAEDIFGQLQESAEHGVYARRKLIRIFEVTNDWQQAIDAYPALEAVDPEAAGESRVAHYYCELAEQAIRAGNPAHALQMLDRADKSTNPTVRSLLVRADVLRAGGEHKRAIGLYGKVMDQAPRLIGEVVPKLAESCRATGEQGHLSASLQALLDNDPRAGKAIGLATIYDPRIINVTALQCLQSFVLADPVLANLVDMAPLQSGDDEARHAALLRVREGLAKVVSQAHRYQCRECGYVSGDLLWQCPGCRNWESVSPSVRLSFSSFVG